MEETVAGLLALNLVVTMMLLMSLVSGEQTSDGAIRYAAQESAAVAASHLMAGAGVSQQREAQHQAVIAARRVLFGICGQVKAEMIPPTRWGLWRSPQVAVEVSCQPGANRPRRSAQGLAWVSSG